jgi:PAS domain-containing protein
MMQPAQIRRWTNEVEQIRRRVRRASRHQENAAAAAVMAECVATCERLLQDLAQGEDERERLRRVALQERDNWQRLFETTPLACVLTDAHGIVLGANRTAALLFNVSAARLTGQLLLHFVTDRQRLHDTLREHKSGDRPLRMPLRLHPREKAVLDVDAIVMADVGSQSTDKLWFLIPPAETSRLQEMTMPMDASMNYNTLEAEDASFAKERVS